MRRICDNLFVLEKFGDNRVVDMVNLSSDSGSGNVEIDKQPSFGIEVDDGGKSREICFDGAESRLLRSAGQSEQDLICLTLMSHLPFWLARGIELKEICLLGL